MYLNSYKISKYYYDLSKVFVWKPSYHLAKPITKNPMEDFIVLLEETETKGKAYIGASEESGAEMTYSKSGDSFIIIDHTEVSPSLRGLGVGKRLLLTLVEMAREKEIKIMPLCPYAKRVFDTDNSLRDVLE